MSSPSRSHQHVRQISDTSPKTALASVHFPSTVLDRFDQDKTPVDKEVVYAGPKVDLREIDCNEEEMTEAQRTKVMGLLEHMSHVLASGDRDLDCQTESLRSI